MIGDSFLFRFNKNTILIESKYSFIKMNNDFPKI